MHIHAVINVQNMWCYCQQLHADQAHATVLTAALVKLHTTFAGLLLGCAGSSRAGVGGLGHAHAAAHHLHVLRAAVCSCLWE